MTHTGLLTLVVGITLGAQQPKGPVRAAPAQVAVPRNPSALYATQLLEVRRPGVAPRVRFSWQHVPGCQEYVLTGRWTDAQSWLLRSQQFRVTPRSATRWENGWVTFDVSLAEGNYSWQLVALFEPHESADYANPAHVSFEVR